MKLVLALLLASLRLQVAAQDCDTSVYHVNPQGSCRLCPDNCPKECDPASDSYMVFTSTDCDGQGTVKGGEDGSKAEETTEDASGISTQWTLPALLITFVAQWVA